MTSSLYLAVVPLLTVSDPLSLILQEFRERQMRKTIQFRKSQRHLVDRDTQNTT